MAFKVPLVKPRTTVHCSGLLVYDFAKLFNKEEIGKGAYGAVFTADYPSNGIDGKGQEKVVVKKMLGEDLQDKKTFVKEARILEGLKHQNIVCFKGICNNPFALVLEHVHFDFKPFGMETVVSSLADFVAILDSFDCEGFDGPRVFSTICKDIVTGLHYLHGIDVCHRDLKPANILVSNQHYCDLHADDITRAWSDRPVVCKLTDFGESRSKEFQTNSLLTSQTRRVNRGTPVYMAPEIVDGTTRLQVATTEDLKRVDIWALGMTLFVLLNPCVKYPYSQELKCFLEKGESALKGLEKLMTQRKIPAEPLKYQHKHAVDWYFIERISKACIHFTPKERPTIEEVVAMIGNEPTASSVQIHLKNSQSTSLEEFDREVARVVAKNGEFDAENALSQPDNDGTNACALSIKITNEIYRLFQEGRCDDKQFVENVCTEAERIIIDLPFPINP